MKKIFNEKTLSIVLNIAGWTLIVLSIAPLTRAIYVSAYPVFSDQNFDSDTIRLVGELVTMSGILAALGATLLAQFKNLADKKEQLSLYHLESCVSAYKKACNTLRGDDDGLLNNDCVKWSRAARMLVHTKELEVNITEKSHRLVFTAYMLEYQHILHATLRQPAGFYYGAPRELIADTNASAKWAAEQEKQKKDFVSISEESLHAMVEVAKWFDKYVEKDPLHDRGFSQIHHGEVFTMYPIVTRYPNVFAYLAKRLGKTYPTGSANDDF